eukprot:gene18439-33886_t
MREGRLRQRRLTGVVTRCVEQAGKSAGQWAAELLRDTADTLVAGPLHARDLSGDGRLCAPPPPPGDVIRAAARLRDAGDEADPAACMVRDAAGGIHHGAAWYAVRCAMHGTVGVTFREDGALLTARKDAPRQHRMCRRSSAPRLCDESAEE